MWPSTQFFSIKETTIQLFVHSDRIVSHSDENHMLRHYTMKNVSNQYYRCLVARSNKTFPRLYTFTAWIYKCSPFCCFSSLSGDSWLSILLQFIAINLLEPFLHVAILILVHILCWALEDDESFQETQQQDKLPWGKIVASLERASLWTYLKSSAPKSSGWKDDVPFLTHIAKYTN